MSINNSTCKSHAKVQEALKIYFGSSQIQKKCKENVDAAIAAFGPAITKGDRMVIRNKHINAGYQTAQLDPIKMATIENEHTGDIQTLTGKEDVKIMQALPTTLAEVSTRLAKLGGLCTIFVAAVAEDNSSTTLLSMSTDCDTSEVANSPPLTVVANGSESLPVSSEDPAGASPTASSTKSMSEITATPIAPSHDTSIGLTNPPSDILPILSFPFPILSSLMLTSSSPLDNCGELPVMPTSPTLPTPTVSSAILGIPPVVVTPSCQPMTRSLSYLLIPFQPEEQSSHSTRSLSLRPPSSADVSLSLLLGNNSTTQAVDQLPERVSQAPQSYSWSRMTDHKFDAVIATGLNNNQLFGWDSTGTLPELNQPVGPIRTRYQLECLNSWIAYYQSNYCRECWEHG
ncbi:hypothetical protein F5877DRAFT_77289 [Lentinula edodes]|nr:hypothetical protein F5877DRAFT_77289 [Lentinula edodes]